MSVVMKLKSRESVEAYIAEGGYICLKQESMTGEDPLILMMLPDDIPQIISWLQQLFEQSVRSDSTPRN